MEPNETDTVAQVVEINPEEALYKRLHGRISMDVAETLLREHRAIHEEIRDNRIDVTLERIALVAVTVTMVGVVGYMVYEYREMIQELVEEVRSLAKIERVTALAGN